MCPCRIHVSDINTCKTLNGKMSNSKYICWIFDNSNMDKYINFLKTQIYYINF